MSAFPSVPRIIGDTDDEASIHLNQYVGKAIPLRPAQVTSMKPPNKSPQAKSIPSATAYVQQRQQQLHQQRAQPRQSQTQSEPYDNIDNRIIDTINSKHDVELDEQDVNVSYEKYLHSEQQEEEFYEDQYIEEDDEDYEDYLESDDDSTLGDEGSDDEIEEPELHLDGFNEKSVFNRNSSVPSPPRSPIFDQIRQEQNRQKRSIRSKPQPQSTTPKILIASVVILCSFLLTVVIYYLVNSNPIPELGMQKINSNFKYLNDRFNQLESDTKESSQSLKQGINLLSDQVYEIKQNIEKSPISYKNNQIQITPELHQFLFKFIENYSTNQTPQQLTQYIDEKLKSVSIKEIESIINDIKKFQSGQYESIVSEIMSKLPKTPSGSGSSSKELKTYIDKQVTQALDHLNQEIHLRLSNILDNLTIVNNTVHPTPNPSNEIWLNSMLDLFSRGSIKVNYADYSLSARILGFLTSTPTTTNNSHSIWYKMVYGWWIYSDNIHDPHNANHVLMDDDSTWICEAQDNCQLGIRLYQAIIPTDLLVEIEGIDNGILEIGFKPNSKSGHDKLSQFENMSSKLNSYLKKFKQIKKVKLKSGLIHVKFPIRFVNLQVPGRDLYLNFTSKDPIRVKRVKAYGINDVDAVKYGDRFKLMIDKFTQAEDADSPIEESRRQQQYDRQHRVDHYDLDKDIYL
ncbi:hypothetical protein JA1_000290 [Spathaspora sp. JA1]|nr:hypothetical protein JA1_000290 [Spathaspora sp. JA1]